MNSQTPNNQLEFPLFPEGMMEKVREGHRLIEMERMKKEIEHLKHVRDGYKGAFQKLKKNEGKAADNEGGD